MLPSHKPTVFSTLECTSSLGCYVFEKQKHPSVPIVMTYISIIVMLLKCTEEIL